MKQIKTILTWWSMEIISIFDAPFFIKSQYQKWEILFWYEFFIIIPWEATLPIPELFFEIQDLKMNSLERVWLALLELLDAENIKETLSTHLSSLSITSRSEDSKNQNTEKDKYIYWYQEWLKYMEWKESKAIVGCEFMY